MRWERVRKRLKTEGIICVIAEKSVESIEKKEVRCRRSGEWKAEQERVWRGRTREFTTHDSIFS